MGRVGLLERLRGHSRLSEIPVVGLVEQLKDLEDGERSLEGFRCYRQKFDRDAGAGVWWSRSGARGVKRNSLRPGERR